MGERREKEVRKHNVPISIEEPEIGTIYIKKVINYGKDLSPVIRYIKTNKEIKELCTNYPNAIVKIKYIEFLPSELWRDL